MMQKVNVSHGKAKMDKMVRRREWPCVSYSKSLYREQDVRCEVTMLIERKVMKKQRRNKKKKIEDKSESLWSERRFNIWLEGGFFRGAADHQGSMASQ
jgi:hypothetical protein